MSQSLTHVDKHISDTRAKQPISLALSGIGIGVSRAASFLIGLAASVYITRYLGPELYGQYAQMLWLGNIVGMLVIFGFGNGLTRFVSELEMSSVRGAVNGLTLMVLGVVFGLGFVFILLLAGGGAWVAELIGLNSESYVWAALPLIITTPVLSIFTAYLSGRQQFVRVATIGVVAVVASTGTQIVLVVVGASVEAIVLANCVGGAIAFFLLMRILISRWSSERPVWPTSRLGERYFRYSVVMGLVFITDAIVWQRSEMFFLGRFNLTTQAGFYSLAYTLASTAIMLVPGSVASLTMPIASARWTEQGNPALERIFQVSLRFTALLAFPVAILGALIGPALVTMIYGTDYDVAGKLLTILVWGALAGILAWNAASVLQARESPAVLLAIGLFAAVLNIGLDLLLIERFQATGAAIANTLTAFCTASAVLLVASFRLGLKLPISGLGRTIFVSLLSGVPFWLVVQNLPPTLVATMIVSLLFIASYCLLAIAAKAVLPEELNIILNQLPIPVLEREKR